MSLARLAIHSSQFPEAVRGDLLNSLRTRTVNHKFHYDSLKQTQKWLELHQAYSPSRTDPNCAGMYQQSFAAVASRVPSKAVHLIGLGCGGGQKDTALLARLRQAGKEVFYTPSDVSTAMVLVARQAALQVVPEANCFPLVCDLATAQDLPALWLASLDPLRPGAIDAPGPATAAARVFTFLGMIPNFEPEIILPRLASLIRAEDYLLLSANLAPGNDYAAGVERVLPLYDNDLTRAWLLTFLLDLGVEPADGELRFSVEQGPSPPGLKRIMARFHFVRRRVMGIGSEQFEFRAGESVQLFFSYRHTPGLIRTLVAPHGLEVLDEWLTPSGEEGVFLIVQQR